MRNNKTLLLVTLVSVLLFSCGGSGTSVDSCSSVLSEEPSSSVSSEELFVSNVSAVFSLDGRFNPIYPDDWLYENPLFFEGYETYETLHEGVLSIVDDFEYSMMVDTLAEVSSYMSSSDDYAFLVWMCFGHGDNGFWYDFYENTLTRHRVYECAVTDNMLGKLEVVMVSRDMVEDFETVAFASQDHGLCAF